MSRTKFGVTMAVLALIAGSVGGWASFNYFMLQTGLGKTITANLTGILTIVLAALAIIIALAGVLLVIWGKPWLEGLVQSKVDEQIKLIELAVSGRLLGFMGYIFGVWTTDKNDFIHSAIKFSDQAYSILPKQNPYSLIALNNLTYYLAKRGYINDAQIAIKYANILLDEYPKGRITRWLTTYASVVGKYYKYFDLPKQSLRDAEERMAELLTRDDVLNEDKQDAEKHLETIRSAIKEYG